MIPWDRIQTVLLDMDGTLLDLHFDNHFWQHHVPQRYAEKHGLSLDAARDILTPRFRAAEGTLDWYCVDYWTQQLGLDIVLLKEEVDHLIALHPNVLEFLTAVRDTGKRLLLVTNAHGKTITLKFRKTQLNHYFDTVICAHDLGLPKEHLPFWGKLRQLEPFEPETTLLIDDSFPVLRSARHYGIAHLLAIKRPDSRGPVKCSDEFSAITSFTEIMP